MAHVVDAKAGKISIFVGTKHIAYTNRDLAQELLKATQVRPLSHRPIPYLPHEVN